jgi:hypothetical protein
MKLARLFCILVFGYEFSVLGQGTFQNLNFEGAFGLPSSTSPVLVPVTNALPGWTVYEGGTQVNQVFYNGVSAGSALVTLIGTNPAGPFFPALDGNYSATLDAGETSSGFGAAAIGQTGTVPSSAKSIIFIANFKTSALSLSFDGQVIPIFQLAASAGYQTYGGDISAYAGQTGELQFTESPTPANEFNISYLDDIQFSMNPIPEPSTWALLALGGGALLLRRRSH